MRRANDEGPTVGAVGPLRTTADKSLDFRAVPHSGQALRVVEGECEAAQYLDRLSAQQADPDELAVIMSMLHGAMLRGFCRAIEKALGVQHA